MNQDYEAKFKVGDKIRLYGKETTIRGFYISYNDALNKYETIMLTDGRGDPFERSLDAIEYLDESINQENKGDDLVSSDIKIASTVSTRPSSFTNSDGQIDRNLFSFDEVEIMLAEFICRYAPHHSSFDSPRLFINRWLMGKPHPPMPNTSSQTLTQIEQLEYELEVYGIADDKASLKIVESIEYCPILKFVVDAVEIPDFVLYGEELEKFYRTLTAIMNDRWLLTKKLHPEQEEKYYPGIQYQRLFNAISEAQGIPTQSDMDEIIRIVHEDFPKTNNEQEREFPNFSIIQALCRCALAGCEKDNNAIPHQIERLKESLQKEGYNKEAADLGNLLKPDAGEMSGFKIVQSDSEATILSAEEVLKKHSTKAHKYVHCFEISDVLSAMEEYKNQSK